MKITTQRKLVLSLTPEEKDFLNRMGKFANQFDDLCGDVGCCGDCPVYDACQAIGGCPQNLKDFAQIFLNAST